MQSIDLGRNKGLGFFCLRKVVELRRNLKGHI